MNTIALRAEKFNLTEINISNFCIWCGQNSKKNKAHIISEKLIKKNSVENILKQSVCISCNSKWGKIEEWLLNKSPLNLFRFLYHQEKSKGIKEIPQYYFLEEISNWFATFRNKDGDIEGYKQILFKDDDPNMYLLGIGSKKMKVELSEILHETLFKNNCIIDVNESLPDGFQDRIIIRDEINIIVSKTLTSANKIKNWLEQNKEKPIHIHNNDNYNCIEIDTYPFEKWTVQYFWNDKIWELYCLKILFELLVKHKSADFCLLKSFDCIRKQFQSFKFPNAADFEKILLENYSDFPLQLKNKSLGFSFIDYSTIKLSKPLIEISGDIKVVYEVYNGLMKGTVNIGFCPQVNFHIDIAATELFYDIFYSSYDYKDGKFINIKLSKSWKENRMLIFSRGQSNFNLFPKHYQELIPSK